MMLPSLPRRLRRRYRDRTSIGQSKDSSSDLSASNDVSPRSASLDTDGNGIYNGTDAAGKTRLSKGRKYFEIWNCLLYLLAVIFLILVLLAQTNPTQAVTSSTYFLRVNLTNIFVAGAAPGTQIQFLNSIARSIGLHDFYQIGLWGYCEGYNDEGITFCSTPKALFWFNPITIILSELFAGATIPLPAEIITILSLLKLASNIMFSFFLTGVILAFLSFLFTLNILLFPKSSVRASPSPIITPSRAPGLIAILPTTTQLSSKSSRPSIPSRIFHVVTVLITILTLLLPTIAAVLGTAIFMIIKNVVASQPMLNIGANIGTPMMAFMWISAGCVIIAGIGRAVVGCVGCCSRRRKARKAKRAGRLEEGKVGMGSGATQSSKRSTGIWENSPKKDMDEKSRSPASPISPVSPVSPITPASEAVDEGRKGMNLGKRISKRVTKIVEGGSSESKD